MARSGAVTFKGNPLTLAGEEVKVGQAGPDFQLHYFEDGMQEITTSCLQGKPSILSVVPSLDTPVCATQTKKFNEALGQSLLRRRKHLQHPSGKRLPEQELWSELGYAHRRAKDFVARHLRTRRERNRDLRGVCPRSNQ